MVQLHKIGIISNSATPCLSEIKQGNKTVEGRKYSKQYMDIRKNDIIYFTAKPQQNNDLTNLYCVVTYVHKYKTLEEYLDKEGYKNALPWAPTKERAISDYNTWTKPAERKELLHKWGWSFLGIGVRAIKRIDTTLQPRYYDLIKSGKKTIEGRLNKGKWANAELDDIIVFNDNLMVKIDGICRYRTVENMIRQSRLKNILPGVATIEEGVEIYRKIPGYAVLLDGKNPPNALALAIVLVGNF